MNKIRKKLKEVEEIGAFVRGKRKEQGLSQEQLAGAAGTGIRFVSELENGKESAGVRYLYQESVGD